MLSDVNNNDVIKISLMLAMANINKYYTRQSFGDILS